MAEQRCPMCGKPNPEELEVCQYCQARLKPLTAPLGETIRPGDEPVKKSTAELERILPEWLRKARNADDSAEENQPPPTGELPLGGTPSRSSSEQPAPPSPENADLLSGLTSQTGDEEEEIPEWLASLRGGASAPKEAEPQTEVPDWLSDVTGEADAESLPPLPGMSAETGQGTPLSFGAEDEQADWLADLKTEAALSGPEADLGTEDSDRLPLGSDLPDWLGGLGAEGPAAAETPAAPAAEGELPDWLGGLGAEGPIAAETPAAPAAEVELPDWLGGVGAEGPAAAETPAAPALEGELPDWLSGLGAEGPAAAETPAAPALEGELPDWLSGLGAEGPAAAETPAAPALEGELPDWLSGLGAEGPAAAETPAAPALEGELPDWLGGLGAEGPAASETPAAPALEGELPDWLGGLGAEGLAASETPAAPATGSELPDWLAAAVGEPPSAEVPSPQAELPDWLSGLQPEATATPGSETPPAVPPEPQAMPDWLTSLPAAETPVAETPPPFSDLVPPAETPPSAFVEEPALEEAEAAFSMELPDWLASVAPEKSPASAEDAAFVEEGEIAPGSLPSWVQAMRPVEAVVSEAGAEAATEDVVTEGPLAGLRNVLPAGPVFAPVRKPQAFGLKLQAEEEQQANAILLQKMLEAESEPKPLTSPPLLLSERVLRWVLFVLLLLVAGLPLLARKPFTPQSSLFPNETLAAVQVVNALPENAPVLLVFDYDASLSGELEVVAAPLVDHLMLRGSRLALVATTPNGTLLAERFLARTQEQHHYQQGVHYINLGYLPGGPAGIAGFAQHPDGTMPSLWQGQSAWQTPVLQGVKRLSDFEAVVVLSDSAEGAQAWVEQTALWLEEKPLILAVSAQVEPVIRPYVDSGQVKGLVAGLAGGSAYETINGRPRLANHYRDSLSMGLFLSVIALALGGGWSLLSAWRLRREQKAVEV